ncbi:hypothetical protein NGRA_1887 [Nosema granulosis]|uniref:Uncharacterized protein n=1 Tax=Nosema granulosis TaxID=83296 RepID=A0A9P6GYJ6_9MICR|nr:hypothetical protein NGRA_1887 [Nosema granulosis]
MNRLKSATCEKDAVLIEGLQGYKYLGITEDSSSAIKYETFEKVKKEILMRIDRLCKTSLNGANLFRAIIEHSISVINYHIGLIKLEPEEFEKLDQEIRQVLIKHQIHLQPGCKERHYLPRIELGRGLHSVELKSESMLLELYRTLNEAKHSSLRRAAILKNEMESKSHLSQIEAFLLTKYNIEGKMTLENLKEAQKIRLYSDIKGKTYHSKLFRAQVHEMANVKASSTWLQKVNNQARSEGIFC